MKIFTLVLIITLTAFAEKSNKPAKIVQTTTIEQPAFYGFTVKDAKGANVNLSDYKNKVVLVVNVASKCGYTSQYEGLQKLYEDLESRNFVILGFPSNQFFGQEPGTNEEIQKFCKLTYGVSFPIMSKVDVNGDNAIPLYKWLTSLDKFSGKITWNFNKFLINKKGEVVKRYSSGTKPEEITGDIKSLL
jgi:glutathione peroxidase